MARSPSPSFDVPSSPSGRWADDSATSDDEIVWSLSNSSIDFSPPRSQAQPGSPGSDDFIFLSSPESSGVLVPPPTRPVASSSIDPQVIADAFASLSLTPAIPKAKPIAKQAKASTPPQTPKKSPNVKGAAKAKAAATTSPTKAQAAYPSPPSSPAQNRATGKKAATAAASATTPPASPTKSKKKKAKAASVKAKPTEGLGLGQRTVVDDVSEMGEEREPPAFDQAHNFMTSFLENPKPTNNGAMLPLLHALIIELGLLSKFQGNKVAPQVAPKTVPSPFTLPELPRSLRQAKLLLKSHAFINIRDYLNARGDGFAALQKVLHPSRRSLVREIRAQPKKRVPLGWVKKSGLNVLLVSRY